MPLLGFIGRLDYQKGVDLIRDNFDWLMHEGAQLVLLGSGRDDLENSLRCARNSGSGSGLNIRLSTWFAPGQPALLNRHPFLAGLADAMPCAKVGMHWQTIRGSLFLSFSPLLTQVLRTTEGSCSAAYTSSLSIHGLVQQKIYVRNYLALLPLTSCQQHKDACLAELAMTRSPYQAGRDQETMQIHLSTVVLLYRRPQAGNLHTHSACPSRTDLLLRS